MNPVGHMNIQITDEKKLFPLLNISRHRMGIDGKGVTTLISGAGCPLQCKWCINRRLLSDGNPEMVTAEELFQKVRIDDLYFRATGGGITFGGGEALLHACFFHDFRRECGDEWHLCAETSLAVSQDLVAIAAEVIDEFIIDCKDMNPEIYHSYTKGNLNIFKTNLCYLLDRIGPDRIIVRVPLIPEFNTGKDRDNSIECLKQLGVTRFDIFEYVLSGNR